MLGREKRGSPTTLIQRLLPLWPCICAFCVLTSSPPACLADAARETPWLGGVTTSSVYVSLEATNNTENAVVDFGQSASYDMQAGTENAQAAGSNYVHNVKLTGLQPNTQYHYRVRHGASTSADYTFWTAPLPGTSARWGFAADSQLIGWMHNIVAGAAATFQPRMMVYGGDLVDSGSTYSSWNDEWFVSNQVALNATAPFVNAPGNHDRWAPPSLTQAFTQAPNGEGLGGQGYFSFDYGDCHIVVINTQVSYGKGSAQWNFVADDLAGTNKKWKIVASHYATYSYGGVGGGDYSDPTMRQMCNELFEPNGVQMTLAGHKHYYQHNFADGIHHMVIGNFGAAWTYGPEWGPETVYTKQTRCFGIIDSTPNTLTLCAYDASGILLETIVIPEPAGGLILAAGLPALLRRRR